TNFAAAVGALGPASIWLWIVASLGQLVIALVIAELGTRIPLAGYSYQWGARLVNSAYGWFTGAIGLAYLSVGAAAINFVVVAPLVGTLLQPVLHTNPSDPTTNLLITLVIFAANLTINIVSVRLAARINSIAVFTEIVGMVGFAVVLFVAWAIHPDHSFAFLFDTGSAHTTGAVLAALPVAGLMGIFTIVGFELAADLGEEAIQARVTVPRAVTWSVVSAAVLGMVALIGFAIAIPNIGAVAASPAPLAAIVQHWLGGGMAAAFLVLVIFSIFALDIVGLAATGRLVFAMGRDNILPASRFLRRVNTRTRTPIRALGTASGLAIFFTLWGYVIQRTGQGQSAFFALVTATASLPFIVYFLTVLAYVVRRRRLSALPGAFTLGIWARPVMYLALGWTVLVLLLLTVPSTFWSADVVIAVVLVVAAAWYLAVLRRRLARGEAGVRALDATPDLAPDENPGR
ncbi:MAG: amino acid permease, partial [Candidatus Dormibacteraeota bacterium]|nr:amino acid permease [Candidatus Dormibacteraeota bacterium]